MYGVDPGHVLDNVVAYERDTGTYTVRVASDVNPARFDMVAAFRTYGEAAEYIRMIKASDAAHRGNSGLVV